MQTLFSFLFPLCLVALLTGCQGNANETQRTRQDIVRQKVEEVLLPKMDDPDNYEFVSLELMDSTTHQGSVTHYNYLLTFRGKTEPGAEGINKRRVSIGPAPKYDILSISNGDN